MKPDRPKNEITITSREKNRGARALVYREPHFNGRRDLLSPRGGAKRALRDEYARQHGQPPTLKQLKQFRRLVRAHLRATEQPRTDVLGAGGEAA